MMISSKIKQIIRYMEILSNESSDMDGEFGNDTLINFLNNFKRE